MTLLLWGLVIWNSRFNARVDCWGSRFEISENDGLKRLGPLEVKYSGIPASFKADEF